MNRDYENRIKSEQAAMRRITNNDLVCKDCLYRYDDTVKLGNTSVCEMYNPKPNEVLLGEDCDLYDKEESV